MSYRAWPAVVLAGAALTAAGVVVGEHVVDARDGCLDPAAWFVATTPASALADREEATVALHADSRTAATVDLASDTTDTAGLASGMTDPIRGCLDLSRIEIPAPVPAPDGRA